jgi:beta-lactamase superfamily II metal-dependent hydrolase
VLRNLIITIAAIGAIAYGANPVVAGKSDGRLDIYWIDVEGGAATLVVTPAGESLLIDTGNPGHRDPDRIVQVAAREAGVRQLDHVIITHYHTDHFGGAATLATLMPIKHLHDNGEFEGQIERPDKPYLECKVEQRSVISPGDLIEVKQPPEGGPRLEVKCLGTRQKFIDAPAGAAPTEGCAEARPKPIDTSDNTNSVVTLVTFGRFRFFDAGDLTWNLEKELACPTNRVGQVDVYQASHHGMDASNNPVLVRALRPRVAVINNGTTKGCDPNTFATLKELSSVQAIYQVHRNLRPDGTPNAPDEYIANATKECKAAFLKLSVDPHGATYTVSVPSTGHVRTFEVRQE